MTITKEDIINKQDEIIQAQDQQIASYHGLVKVLDEKVKLLTEMRQVDKKLIESLEGTIQRLREQLGKLGY